MPRKRIAVLYEVWWPDERDRPRPPGMLLEDSEADQRGDGPDVHQEVFRALRRLGHQPYYAVLDGDPRSLERLAKSRASMVFNLTESYAGDDTKDFHVAAFLELLGKTFTGSDARALHLGQDKVLTKKILRYHDISTPDFVILEPGERVGRPSLDFPLIVKPSREDGSIGIDSGSVVHDRGSLGARVAYVHEHFRGPALVERYIEGREIYVSIVGNDPAEALPLVEIDLARVPDGVPRIAGVEVKWWTGTPIHRDTPPVYPKRLSKVTRSRAQRVALDAYHALGLRDYGRIDLRVTEDGTPYVIEANPNPWLHPECEFTMAWTKSGRTYDELIERIVALASARGTAPNTRGSTRRK